MSSTLTAEEGLALVALARAAIEDRLFDNGALARTRASVSDTPALTAPRACFVTLKTPGHDGTLELRGCVGATEARLPAREAVVASARDAAFADPRFPALSRDEVSGLVVSVSALTPMVSVPDADSITVGRDGVAIEHDGHFALFLPEVAMEHGWTRNELLEQLTHKAGLAPGAWRRARLKTFQSESFGET